LYTLNQLKNDRSLWRDIEVIPAKCDWCSKEFEVKYGTLYNVIRRDADGIYCGRKCAGAARAMATQKKYQEDGGKGCKRCGEFKDLKNFSSLPNPPYYRAECKRCHNYKPARQFNLYKDKALRNGTEFDLSMDDFLTFFGKSCYYCNSEIKTIRMELLDDSEGYILDNIVSCCRCCQKFKDGMRHVDFIKLCHKISDNVKDSEV
jgi:hypothetical protein